MEHHGLRGWTFDFDNAKRRFGACRFSQSRITLSASLTQMNDEAEVEETILHEIAHPLAGQASHGPHWQRVAASIGASTERCYSLERVNTPPKPLIGKCPECGYTTRGFRRRNVSCDQCSSTYDLLYRLQWEAAS